MLRKGTKLYRGSYRESLNAAYKINQSPNYLRENLPVYFAPNENSAKIYSGHCVEYVTTRDLNLLNMGDPMVVAGLIQLAESPNIAKLIRLKDVPKLVKSIKKAFRISNGNGNVTRFSRIHYDIHVAVFICKLGYDGYYADSLKQKYLGMFHPEVVICNARDALKVVSVLKPTKPPPLRSRLSVNNNLRNNVRSLYNTHSAKKNNN
jgi:hypothetical protein